MKRAMILLLAASLAAMSTGCGKNNVGASAPSASLAQPSSSLPAASASADEPSSLPEEPDDLDEPEDVQAESAPADLPLSAIVQSIADAYGENYLATGEMPEDYIAQAYPELSGDMYDDILGNMALISAFPDELIVVKAAAGRADDVEKALGAIADRRASDSLQYPMNLPKTAAARVVRHGDYLAYILLGTPMENNDATEEEQLRHFEDEAQKGADAFDAMFAD